MRFAYTARTQQGDLQTGKIEAGTLDGALDVLQRHDLIVINISAEKDIPFFKKKVKFLQKVKLKEKMIFSRQLSTLFESKIPLVESLRTLSVQTENEYFKEIIMAISADVDSGTSLSVALEKHPKIFSTLYVNMVRAGEISGKLQEVFNYLADFLEREHAIRSKVKSVMTYPAVILSFFIIIFVLVMIFIIPPLKDILSSGSVELPILTRIVLALSDAFVNYWYLFVIGVAAAIVGAYYFMNTDMGKDFWDRGKLKLPIFGQLYLKMYLSRFCDNLSTLIIGGLPITQAIEVTGAVVGSRKFQKIMEDAADQVRRGNPINVAFAKYSEIPPMVVSMVAVGESTGRLDQTLKNVAVFYQREVSDTIDTVVSLVEPLMIAFLGVGTGIFLAAILMPIYNLAQGIN